ncbi:Transmembrane protein [Phytophthora megakarya]|uniref:Transmembrane protein n=1 Tax=Phytophthora megakarya TaxID=4795 RepID=A0A225VUZ1_9STRA|nr:Transmembrane protein [Phytophthora megakarya]
MQAKQADGVPKLPVITIVPDANPTFSGRRRGGAAVIHQRRTSPTWSSNFCDCCCSVAPTYCCIVTCCPCTTIASVKESLGGGYERTLLYFGGLALGFLVCVGFAASSKSNEPATPSANNTTAAPTHHTDTGNWIMWESLAAMFLMTFLFGICRIRMQTRHVLGIQGSLLKDCLASVFCCFCVISQLHLELKCNHEEPPATRHTQYYRRGQGDDNLAVDTLAPYAVM